MADPRIALQALTAAFERRLEACAQRRGEDDPSVVAAYDDLADAFEEYDDALLEAYGEMTPLDVYAVEEDDDSDDDDDDDDDDDEDEDAVASGGADAEDDSDADQRYLGLDEEEFDVLDIDGIDDADPAAQGEDLDDLDEVDHQAHPT